MTDIDKPKRPFLVRKRSVQLASGRVLEFGRVIEDHRIVDDILIIVFAAIDGIDPENVLAVDSKGKARWRKSSWIGTKAKGYDCPYVGIDSTRGTINLFSADCHRVTVRPKTGRVITVEFTK